uniref:Oxidoreductase FAD/NAD(P)-binding domain-containing protein n=1 Tax=Fibrocapsa japonica TaxID=94617 RepID=A0A7S2UVS4_9STRA|eukprot:CAMPEP_0113935936 /NCGR_PEP_ID=MMETSP1339-20121228/2958_1 /TAXON_ID=94617 /ORGANISM="Fibrocapsa japonica" /LENGTH=301 /DNA_ID=CAMNT_0000938241 /DNA_START=111 /DNA_END=1016 /DNA_ORIENTATION=+ /assembly_acc=CAM_ASM_000762
MALSNSFSLHFCLLLILPLISHGFVNLNARNVLHLETSQLLQTARQSCRSQLKLSANDIAWNQVKVLENKKAAEGLKSIVLDVGDIEKSYTNPGQYVQLRPDASGKPGFYAIANAPAKAVSKGAFEFLIKETEGNTWLTGAEDGAALEMTGAMGKGYAIQENFLGYKYDWPCINILLFACGSGIAPVRAAIENGLTVMKGSPLMKQCRLYYGVKTPDHLAYKDKFEAWAADGVEIVPVVSRPEGTGWTGRTGYIQDALKADGVDIPRNSGAIMCGHKEMVESVKETMAEAGSFEGRFLLNF